MRAVADRRVMKALCGIGAPELWPAERERVREAADALLLFRDLEEPDVRHALAAVPVLTDDLIDAERWTPLARAAAPATSGLAVRTSLGCSDGHITGASFRGRERGSGRDKHSASDGAVNPKLTAEDAEPVVERQGGRRDRSRAELSRGLGSLTSGHAIDPNPDRCSH